MSDARQYDYDLLVIGGGSGGLAAAKQAAAYGANVGLAEEQDIGGTCVNRGCIAKRLMVYAADFPRHFDTATTFGWSQCQSQFDWGAFTAAMRQHTDKLGRSQMQALQDAGVELLLDRATLIDPHTVQVGDRQITADNILIAVGGQPTRPDIPGIDLAVTSDDMFHLQQLPQRIVIMGGGYIGVEFSSVLCGLGCDVTLIDIKPQILDGFDPDVRQRIQSGLMRRGIQFWGETKVAGLEKTGDGITVTLKGDRCPDRLTADLVLCAVGRQPSTRSLGLEQAGVELEKGAIKVDAQNRTTQTNIYAVGDCTDRIQLTPVARAEGEAAVAAMFGKSPRQIDYSRVPSAVCSRPEGASVGLSEDEARAQYGDRIRCYHTEFQTLFYSLCDSDEKVFLKLVVDDAEKVLGAHMVGDRAAEIIQTLAVAVSQGVTRSQLQQTIGIHPTEGEELYDL